jgi:hypothetical protein
VAFVTSVAVADGDTNLGFPGLPIEVSHKQAQPHQYHSVHPLSGSGLLATIGELLSTRVHRRHIARLRVLDAFTVSLGLNLWA